jgi:hypothetical protein
MSFVLQNTAAFIHDLPADSLANVDGDRYMRAVVPARSARR